MSRLIHDDSDYTIGNLFETISELEHDLNKRADTFFGCAYQEYKNFCSEAEKIAEEIGKDLSDDDLVKLGIQEEQTNLVKGVPDSFPEYAAGFPSWCAAEIPEPRPPLCHLG